MARNLIALDWIAIGKLKEGCFDGLEFQHFFQPTPFDGADARLKKVAVLSKTLCHNPQGILFSLRQSIILNNAMRTRLCDILLPSRAIDGFCSQDGNQPLFSRRVPRASQYVASWIPIQRNGNSCRYYRFYGFDKSKLPGSRCGFPQIFELIRASFQCDHFKANRRI